MSQYYIIYYYVLYIIVLYLYIMKYKYIYILEREKSPLIGLKPPLTGLKPDFKLAKWVLLVFLAAAGWVGEGFSFLPSYGFGRMGTRSSPYCSQLPSLQPSSSSVRCLAPTALLHPVSYTHLTLPTIGMLCRSRWSPYH